MATTHNLGFPRIGGQRELKFALEDYWAGRQTEQELAITATDLRRHHWQQQAGLDFVPVGDFSLYDQVLDMSVTLGNLPARVADKQGSELDAYFRAARGRGANDSPCRSEEHTSELQSRPHLVCRLLLEKKKKNKTTCITH